MKAEEIRKTPIALGMVGTDSAYFLKEIAAQFADLNERLDGFMVSLLQVSKDFAQLTVELQKNRRGERYDT